MPAEAGHFKPSHQRSLRRGWPTVNISPMTYGRLTGRPGVCLVTLGPGATNLMTAAAYEQLGAMPMMMITGQKPIKSSKQGHFQIVDVVQMMQPLTKFTRQIVSADRIPAQVREAFRLAREERPGACHLELPEDIARETSDVVLIPASYTRRPQAEDQAIAHAAQAIRDSRRLLLMVGAGANRNTTCRMLRRFVDALGIPFFTTQMGKGVLDDRPVVDRQRRVVGRRFRAPGDRTRRLHHQCRP